MSRGQMTRQEQRWLAGCCLLPMSLVLAFSIAVIYWDFFGGDFGNAFLTTLAVVGGILYLLYALHRREQSSSASDVQLPDNRTIPRVEGPRTPTAKELTWRFETVPAMSGSQFELFVTGLFRAMGHNTRVLGGSGDQGVDLIVDYQGERVAVQCKNYKKPVGNRPVQEVFTGAKHHRCQQAWVVAPAGFTNGADELASSVGVKLFDSASIKAWIRAVDRPAGLVSEPSGSPPPRSEIFPPTSEQRKKDSEGYRATLDLYEMELVRLERLNTLGYPYSEDRVTNASIGQIWFDTDARIFKITKQLDAFEKLNTGLLEEKQRHAQLKARHEQIKEKSSQNWQKYLKTLPRRERRRLGG
jgi:restriction system protein